MFGGEGTDIFLFSSLAFGRDVIRDFEDGYDRLSFGSTGLGLADFTLSQVGDDAVLTLNVDPTQSITLRDTVYTSVNISDVL